MWKGELSTKDWVGRSFHSQRKESITIVNYKKESAQQNEKNLIYDQRDNAKIGHNLANNRYSSPVDVRDTFVHNRIQYTVDNEKEANFNLPHKNSVIESEKTKEREEVFNQV